MPPLNIEESKIFKFQWTIDGSAYNFAIQAESKEKAAETIKKNLGAILSDLSMNFPNKPLPPKK